MKEKQPAEQRIDASPLNKFEARLRKLVAEMEPGLEAYRHAPEGAGHSGHWHSERIIELLNRQYSPSRDNEGLIESKYFRQEYADLFAEIMDIDLNNPICTRSEVGHMNSSIDTEYFPTPIDGITMSHRIVTNDDGTINDFGTYYEIERRSPGSFERFVKYINDFENQT